MALSQETSQEIDLESKSSQENNKKKIIMLIKSDPSITQAKIAQQFGLTRAEVRYIMDQLQQNGILKREGSIKKGKWIIEKLI